MKTAAIFFLLALALAGAAAPAAPRDIAGEPGQYAWDRLATANPGFFFYRGPAQAREVALTFDDAPDDKATPQVLDILKENHVRGTFFVIGENALAHPDLVRRMVAEGHVVGNHTWSHSNLVLETPAAARRELVETADLLERLTGLRPALVRTPWGKVSAAVMDLARQEGWRLIGWSADSFDWRDADGVLANLHAQIRPGSIVLLHAVAFPASRNVTVRVLPALIADLKKQGYHLVTVDRLLHVNAYKAPLSRINA